MNEHCCSALQITLNNKPLQLWSQYAGLYIISKDKINGRHYFVKIDDRKSVALWYISNHPMDGDFWGFGDLEKIGSYSVMIGSYCNTGPNCPHEVPINQWMYLDAKILKTEEWLFGGIYMNVEQVSERPITESTELNRTES